MEVSHGNLYHNQQNTHVASQEAHCMFQWSTGLFLSFHIISNHIESNHVHNHIQSILTYPHIHSAYIANSQ